jgi:hypothetical protein
MLFSFGRDVNIHWKHGVNALPDEEQDGKGRISIILWGLAPNVIEENGSPRILDDNTRGGGHSIHSNNKNNDYNNNRDAGRSNNNNYNSNNSRSGGNGYSGTCRDFQKGQCRRGDNCRFSHNS